MEPAGVTKIETSVRPTTVKLPPETVTPLTVRVRGPVMAPAGTVTVSKEAVAVTTVAVVPLNLTRLEAATVLNP